VAAVSVGADMFRRDYEDVFSGDETWRGLEIPTGERYEWGDVSTYVRKAAVLRRHGPGTGPVSDVEGARVLAVLGDSVTTDHISPAGAIRRNSPAGEWLIEHGVEQKDFNSYGARRGNHEVMVRGTFANPRIRNGLVSEEGGVTAHLPDGEEMTSSPPPSATGKRASLSSSSPGRSTDRARRVTGRPRDRCCSACGR